MATDYELLLSVIQEMVGDDLQTQGKVLHKTAHVIDGMIETEKRLDPDASKEFVSKANAFMRDHVNPFPPVGL